MTRFLYIADTHLGANHMGFQQQQGYPEKLPEILSALGRHLAMSGGIDFILHGGDMINATTKETIITAAKTFDLAVPVYLCLGNHDLTTTDAIDLWLRVAPQFFIGGTPDYTLVTEDCVIHVTPNHWDDLPFYWGGVQKPHFSPVQTERLARELSMRPDLPHVILTHSPVFGLPQAQTGLPTPYHCPEASFTAEITALAAKHTHIRCVLGAHNHLNMRLDSGGVEYVTVSSLVETPFEFKLFEVQPQQMKMTTLSLGDALAFDSAYDATKAFVQGRDSDRSFVREF